MAEPLFLRYATDDQSILANWRLLAAWAETAQNATYMAFTFVEKTLAANAGPAPAKRLYSTGGGVTAVVQPLIFPWDTAVVGLAIVSDANVTGGSIEAGAFDNGVAIPSATVKLTTGSSIAKALSPDAGIVAAQSLADVRLTTVGLAPAAALNVEVILTMAKIGG